KGGTNLFGVKIYDADINEWRTYERKSFLGTRPAVGEFDRNRHLLPKDIFVALNLSAAVDDTFVNMYGQSNWRRFRYSLTGKSLQATAKKLGASMGGMMGMPLPVADTQQKYIDKLLIVHKSLLKEKDRSALIQRFQAYQAADQRRQALDE